MGAASRDRVICLNADRWPESAICDMGYERTFPVLKSLPCDICLGAHGSWFGLEAKYARMRAGARESFVDPTGCMEFVRQRSRSSGPSWRSKGPRNQDAECLASRSCALFRGDQDNAVYTPRPVHGGFGGGLQHTDLLNVFRLEPVDAVVRLDQHGRAVDDVRLAAVSPRQSLLLQYCYFGGLSLEESALAAGVSLATAKRDLRAARAWLASQLQREPPP